MSLRFTGFTTSFVIIGLISCALFTLASPAFGQSPDEVGLRSLSEKFFAAYQKQDLDGLMLLWSEKSPDYVASKKNFQQSFAANKLEVKSLTLGKATIDGEKANVRVAVEINAIDAKTSKPAAGFGKLNRTLHFVKEGGDWKVTRFVSSEEELAAALVEAKTEVERKQLLETYKELVTVTLVRALLTQGTRLYGQGNLSLALPIHELTGEIANQLGDKKGTIYVLRGVGNINMAQGNYPQALDYYQRSLKLAEETGDKAEIGGTLNNLGIVHKLQSNYPQALDYYQRSLKLAEEIGDKVGMSRGLKNIGNVLQSQSSYTQALVYYERSLKLDEEVGNKAGLGNTLNNIGIVHHDQGNYTQALEYYQKSLKLKEEIGNKAGISNTLNNIGNVHHDQGNYTQALVYYERSLKLDEEVGNKAGLSSTLNNIGIVHHDQGNYTQALDYYQKSLKLKGEIGDKAGLGNALNNIGIILQWQGNYPQALDYYQRSLKVAEEIGDKYEIGNALNNLGSVHQAESNYTRALDYYQKSLKLQEEIGNKAGQGNVLKNLGVVYQSQGDYQQAVEFANRATTLALQMGSFEQVWDSRVVAGQAFQFLHQPDAAKKAFADAISAIEELRNQIAGDEHQRQLFFAGKIAPYYGMVTLMVDQKDVANAFAFAERAKARALLDVLQTGRLNITRAMSTQEQREERSLNNELVSLNSQLFKEKQGQQPDQARLADLTARLEKARLQLEVFHTNLYTAHPELRVHRGEIRPLTLNQSAAVIPDKKAALLEFVVQEDQTYLFVLTKNGMASQAIPDLQVYKLAVNQKDLADLTHRFNQRIAGRSLGFQELAAQLYNLLLKPAQAQLQNLNRLIIVPDGVLWELPFQALLSAPHHFLLEDYAISYAPSLSVLKEMNALHAKRQKTNAEAKTLLAIGNPAIGTQTAERVASVFMDEKLLPLPEAERQVKALEQIYGVKNSKIYVGAEASEAHVKQEAESYKILHLATHGIFNDASPMYSHLVLAQAQGDVNNDGLLEAWEIMKLDLNADLVVLSACDTARGRVGAGEGMIGLAWALFVAGCPTTVVSQWKVETESNTELMLAFHRQLKAGAAKGKGQMSKAEALRQAALQLMRSKKYNHPFYWAPFIIVGDAN